MLAMRNLAFMCLFIALILPLFPIVIVNLDTPPQLFLNNSELVDSALIFKPIWILSLGLWIYYWTRVVTVKTLQTANQEYLETLFRSAHGVRREPKTTSEDFIL